MPLDPTLEIGVGLVGALAGLYIPGSATEISALEAIFAAVEQYDVANNKPKGYVPSRSEWDAFISERESKRIPGV